MFLLLSSFHIMDLLGWSEVPLLDGP